MMKKYLLFFLCSFLFYVTIGVPLKGIVGMIYTAFIESVCYIIITYSLLKKYSKSKQEVLQITGIIILGRIILEIPLRLMDFEPTLISFPCTLLVCFTIILTSIAFTTKNIYVCLFFFFVWGYCVFIGHKKLLEYIVWGPSLCAQVGNFTVNTSKGNIHLKNIQSKYILLDFWISKCSICYEEFPKFQLLYNKNKGAITIASVFVPYLKSEQQSDGENILDRYGYTFPAWSVSSTDTLLKTLKINRFPTIILLDKDRNVIFRGSMENAEKKLEDIIGQ